MSNRWQVIIWINKIICWWANTDHIVQYLMWIDKTSHFTLLRLTLVGTGILYNIDQRIRNQEFFILTKNNKLQIIVSYRKKSAFFWVKNRDRPIIRNVSTSKYTCWMSLENPLRHLVAVMHFLNFGRHILILLSPLYDVRAHVNPCKQIYAQHTWYSFT